MTARKPISKKTRFEVFKRDSFKCQYCGASAPEVLLEIDHIKPISKGGTNKIINLITACDSCNRGKADREINDKSLVAKQRTQLEKLQKRREQLEMMMQWAEGLKSIGDDRIDRLCKYWEELAPGFVINELGKEDLKKWLRKFSLEDILKAMNIAADQYLKRKKDGKITSKSWSEAFTKIPGICRVEKASAEDPEIRDLYYIRGIIRNRCERYFDNHEALEWLKQARSWDVPLEDLRCIAHKATSFSRFRNMIWDAIEEQKKIQKNKEKGM